MELLTLLSGRPKATWAGYRVELEAVERGNGRWAKVQFMLQIGACTSSISIGCLICEFSRFCADIETPALLLRASAYFLGIRLADPSECSQKSL